MRRADAVIICVPTPIDRYLMPDLTAISAACASAVANARVGQLIVLTSTTYVGTTRDLLVTPLRNKGFKVGRDVFVAFSPERIDPGNADHPQHTVPRVVGGADGPSAERAVELLADVAPTVHLVSSTEAAEMTKLYENTFRAVNIAFALEMADAASVLGLSITEVIQAAATKPYGFMPFYPGPGVGGHCIPVDPYYLLWQLRAARLNLPVVEQAMNQISTRPMLVASKVRDLLAQAGHPTAGARVLLVGASYKPGVRDTRGSPAAEIARRLLAAQAHVELWDPVAPELDLGDGRILRSIQQPASGDFDAVVVQTIHPGQDLAWLSGCNVVLDATYRLNVPGAETL
jgi:UDP-N-acetyl-D-glucosamine dehydrogenase